MSEGRLSDRGNIITRRAFLASVGGTSLAGMFAGEARAKRYKVRTVVIDPGHGGHDRGGSYGLVYEKHLNLDVAFRLNSYLKGKGVRTVLSRSRDQFISLGGRSRLANSQRDSIFVSIHFNWTWNRSSRGVETFYYNSGGYALGRYVHSRLIKKLRPEDRGLKRKGFYVLRHTRVPGILVEGGFLSNTSERNRCLQPWYRQLVAQSVGEGILQFK